MDRQQLLQIVNQALRATPLAEATARSLAVSMRLATARLESHRSEVPSPQDPLPSAEAVAAFVEGYATAEEERQVIAACVHDVGILLQVMSTAEALDAPLQPMPNAQMLDRLLTLSTPRDFEAAVTPAVHKPRRRRMLVISLGIAAAILLALGWVMTVGGLGDASRRSDQAFDPPRDPSESSRPQMAAAPGSEADPDYPEEPGPTLPDGPSSSQPAALAKDSTQPAVVEQPSDAWLPPNQQPFDGLATPEFDAWTPGMLAAQPKRPPPSPDAPPVTAVAWTQVTGVLAEQSQPGYDKWKLVSTRASSDASSDGSGSWLTLPSCFARGELTLGGQLVMNEQSSVEAVVGDQSTLINLRFGSIALVDLPPRSHLQLIGSQTEAHPVLVATEAAFELRRVLQGLELTVGAGELQLRETRLRPRTTYLIRGSRVEVVETERPWPQWSRSFPRATEVSEEIIDRLARADDLSRALDRQLLLLAKPATTGNPVAVARFVALCRWRASLGVEDATEVVRHPMWPVRMVAFEQLLAARFRLPAVAARQRLFSKMSAAEREHVRSWFEIASGRRVATRQDVAVWLGWLTGEDPDLAAFGDFMLRKCFTPAPDFSPTASLRARTMARKAWTAAVADR